MKDLRDFNYVEIIKMPDGHLESFQTKLNKKTRATSMEGWIQKFAAILIIGILISTHWIQPETSESNSNPLANETIKLNDVSPELGTLASFIQASINYELATLDYGNYEDVAFSYLDELERIENDYKELQKELKTSGFNQLIIEAMIENLQLRLELLQNLKLKLNELRTLNHEKNTQQQL